MDGDKEGGGVIVLAIEAGEGTIGEGREEEGGKEVTPR